MALFQLDPQSIAARARAAGSPIPTLRESLTRGTFGFTVVSVLGFSPWAIFDVWLRHLGEMELYFACGAVFIGASGLLLHRLIIGSGSLGRFYKLFGLSFTGYAAVWVFFWMWLRGDLGSAAGLLGGTALMGGLLAASFGASVELFPVIAILFAGNTLGYFGGGWAAGKLAIDHRLAGMLVWGACYGAGFGAGLGAAFHRCQAEARALLAERN